MRVRRASTKTVMLASVVLTIMIAVATSYAQTRPGIRAFVTPPEGCYLSDPVEPEDVYSFLRVEILALSLAERGAVANTKMLKTTGGAPFEEVDKTIAGLREERIANTCASFVVSDYKDSQDQTISTVAKYLAYAYDQFGDMSNQMLGINLQKAMRRVNGPSPQRQLSTLIEKRQEILRDMTDALNLTLWSLIDDGRKNAEGKPDHLILNHAQINDLLDYLYTRFPNLKDNQGAVPSGDFAKQAASIRAFLASGYKPAGLP